MIVTTVAIAITLINCFVYFAPLADYLTSEYWMARKISKRIAHEDLKSAMPDLPDLTASINNTLAVLIVILRMFGISVEYLSGTICIFVVSTVVFLITVIINRDGSMKQIISTVLAVIFVIVFCLAT